MNPQESISKKTLEQLQEMLERQIRLSQNKKLILSLADKGNKIQESIKNIRQEIKHRNDVDDVALSFSRLSYSDKRPADLDSDDDWPPEGSSGENPHDPEPKEEILKDAFAQQRAQKVNDGVLGKINPFRLNHAKERPKRKAHFRHLPPSEKALELSALSPVFSDTPAKLLTISDSLDIQKNHHHKIKEAEKERKVERIYERFGPALEQSNPELVEQLLYTPTMKQESEDESEISDDNVSEDETTDRMEDEHWVESLEETLNEIL